MAGRGSSARTILANVGSLLGAEVVGRILTFVALMHLTRALGPDAMGMVEFGLALFALLTLVGVGGIEILGKRQVARTTRGMGRIGGTVLLVGWAWLAAALLLLGVGLSFVDRPPPTLTIAAGFAAAALIAPLGLRFAFLGRERMDRLAIATVLGQLTWAAAVLLVVKDAEDVTLIPALWLSGEAVRVTVLLLSYRKLFGRLQRPKARALRAWAIASVPVGLGRIARGALYIVDVFILGLFAPLAVVGLYGVALRLPLFVVSSGVWVHHSLFPSIVRLLPDPDGLARLQGIGLRAATSLGLAVALTLGIAAEDLLCVAFGVEFAPAAPIMAVLAWKVPLSSVGGLYRNVVWAASPQREAVLSVTGSLLTIAAAAIGAVVWGAMGCATAMVAGEAFLLVAYLWGSREHPTGLGPWLRVWLPLQVLALGIIGAWWWLLPDGRWIVSISAVLVGGVAGVLPLLPWARELREALRG